MGAGVNEHDQPREGEHNTAGISNTHFQFIASQGACAWGVDKGVISFPPHI